MSNITCPTCGVVSYDCGKAGFKTKREIELEKQLEIAVKALEDMARQCDLSWYQAKAEQTLKDIEEIR